MNIQLQQAIIKRSEEEQTLRALWSESTEVEAKQLRAQIDALDLKNASLIEEVINKYGWPGFSKVGKEGSHGFFILVQHTPNLALKERALKLLQEALKNQEAQKDHFALLKDRVSVSKGLPQLYGTQFQDDFITPYPIEDEEHLEERRKEMGLSSMEEYRQGMKRLYLNRIEGKK